jgi:hypothetical protein
MVNCQMIKNCLWFKGNKILEVDLCICLSTTKLDVDSKTESSDTKLCPSQTIKRTKQEIDLHAGAMHVVEQK